MLQSGSAGMLPKRSCLFFSLIDSRSPNTEKMNDVFPDSYKSFSSNMLIFILANFNKKNFFLL